jgi:hypothetical protein
VSDAPNTMLKQFRAARRVGTPLIAVQTPDPAATIEAIKASLEASAKAAGAEVTTPLIQWDICRGWLAVNDLGEAAIQEACAGAEPSAATANPTEGLMLAEKLPERTILFLLNGQRYLTNDASPAAAGFAQALWNLRDPFKKDLRSVVMLGPSFAFPAELQQDVLVLDEPLPEEEDLRGIVSFVVKSAELEGKVDRETEARAVDALRGLAAFPAEQVTAMSLTSAGLDVDAVWERKRRMIESTPGLAVFRGGERFSSIGGVEQAKQFFSRVIAGREAPRVVVFIDEIEKMLAGATGGTADSSGVSQGFLGALLSYMQDNEASGSIFVGPPGAAKSALAKAVGAEASVPTIALDLGGMKASLVGESEGRLRAALKVITAVGGGRALFLATCNKIATLPPELRRRFTMGTFFFDLPDQRERELIWQLYTAKFRLDASQVLEGGEVRDDGWTGAEIRQCCLLAYRLRMTLAEASQFVVPVAKSAAEEIEALRRQAAGKFLSASRPGVYQYQPAAQAATAAGAPARRIKLED